MKLVARQEASSIPPKCRLGLPVWCACLGSWQCLYLPSVKLAADFLYGIWEALAEPSQAVDLLAGRRSRRAARAPQDARACRDSTHIDGRSVPLLRDQCCNQSVAEA